jgi:hypothetical protein
VGTPVPNALPEGHLPYIRLPAGHLQEVVVVIEMADGKTIRERFPRAAILMP